MTDENTIFTIYLKLQQAYEPITKEVLGQLMSRRDGVERPKVMFPPNDGVTFDAQLAESGFLQRNCAAISAYRQKNPDGSKRSEEENIAASNALENELTSRGLSYFKLDGCFRETMEEEASHEISLFVYDDGAHRAKEFFKNIYELSESYLQDSFLYKSAGMTRFAFFISTNEDSRTQDGDIKPAGKLYLNLPPIGPYTNLNNGERFTFSVVPPSDEEQNR